MTLNEEIYTSIWSHLDDLRSVLCKALVVILAGFLLSFFFYQELLQVLLWPLHRIETTSVVQGLERQQVRHERIYNKSSKPVQYTIPSDSFLEGSDDPKGNHSQTHTILPGDYLDVKTVGIGKELTFFTPVDGFLSVCKVCFWSSLVLTSPLWLYFVTAFIAPALRRSEKMMFTPFLACSVIFLTGGGVFAYLVTIPIANAFFWSFNERLGNNLWSLSGYLDFTLFLLLASALAFEMALALFFLVHFGIISYGHLIANRRYAIVCILILGALFTPPDVFSQLMLSIPLIGLYEVCILYARLRKCLRTAV